MWKKMVWPTIRASLFLLFVSLIPGMGTADEGKGRTIAETMRSREKGFINFEARMRMVLISVSGKETERRLRVKTREVENDGDQTVAIFDAPADVKGTVFLTHTHIDTDDDQWLYLPSLKRVKRIAPNNKTAPFMGSEFSYEDLASTEVDKYTYDYVGDEDFEGKACFVLERMPKDTHSGYGKERVWVEKERYLALKIDYYSRKGEKLKTLVSNRFDQYLDEYWKAHEMRMENHFSGKSTVLYWDEFEFRGTFHDADFNPAGMERIR